MTRRRLLVTLSSAQLVAGVVGLTVALRRRRPYDLPFARGQARHVGRDSVLLGTAYSAPVPMMVAQLGSTIRLATRGDRRAVRDLTVLGSLMVPGYLLERAGRDHLRRWDPVETPIVAAGLGLAAAMVVVGARGSAADERGMRGS